MQTDAERDWLARIERRAYDEIRGDKKFLAVGVSVILLALALYHWIIH